MPTTAATPLITSRTVAWRTAPRASWCHYLDQPVVCRSLLRLLVSDHVASIRRIRADRHACHDTRAIRAAIALLREKHSYFVGRARQQVAA